MEGSASGDSMKDEPRGGLWNSPRVPQYSKETQDLIKLMMHESKLTNFQQRQINNEIMRGGALPLVCNPTSSTPTRQVVSGAGLTARPQRRTAEMCRSGDNYKRERFRPSAARDLEKEKMRLQNILAEGKKQPNPSQPQEIPHEKGEPKEDRFQEVLDEIKDRVDFLEEMSALGRGKAYQNIISVEISQKIRELELIDKALSENMVTEMERRGLSPRQ
ncbi:UPF0193 protein EVG1 [Megalops cyprinoides]|uniref:UPF0193 protein EVG1 n=1 Tax=Megalops cyprinoides TaxID=118141 RepID=UPI001863E8F2|nr:UPF0193 protein EVG1 [Megalops cyprinoides]